MADLVETPGWEPGIYQWETTDPVEGGPAGVDNVPTRQLANRTAWLKQQVEGLGTDKQPLDATLSALAALVLAADKMIYATGADAVATTTITAFGRSLIDDADAAAARTTLGAASPADIATAIANLVASSPAALDTLNELATALGNDANFAATMTAALGGKQPLDATLTALAALATVADRMIYATGADAFATTPLTAFARTVLDDADAATMRATLGAAPTASPALTGVPTAPTAAAATNTTQLATTAFVQAAVTALINASPAALDTLNELAAALGNDANFAATVTAALALKAPLASPAFTGAPTVPTAAPGTNTTQAASTAFVGAAVAAANFALRGYRYGLEIANNVGNPNTHIDIAAGVAVDSTAVYSMALAAPLTKILQAAGAWAAGTGNNGLFSGARANSTWYHAFLIRKTADGTIDAGFDTSLAAANIPVGYGAYRRIGSIKTDGAGNILGFFQIDDEFWWATPPIDVNVANLGAASTSYTLSVPSGINVVADFHAYAGVGAGTASVYIRDPNAADLASSEPPAGMATLANIQGVVETVAGGLVRVRTNTAAQVAARSSSANTTFVITTRGWREKL
jgi:hypothetical protein